MNSLSNSVRLTGFLGAAPEVKMTNNEKKYARISLATRDWHRNSQNELVQQTEWHKLMLWDKQAEVAQLYLKKGSEVAIAGKLINRFYTDKDGVKRSSLEVIVTELMLLGKKGKS
jgi:single-strand DNA-binding protein